MTNLSRSRPFDESFSSAVESAADTFVQFAGVQKTFDGTTLVLKDINLDVRQGEFMTFLGPSGSGKTTALLLLAGFEAPTGGDLLLAGRSLRNVPPNRRDIGMVFQNYALFPHMTVFENLAFPLLARKVPSPEIKLRVDRSLEMVQLGGYEKRRPNELSGGQQQRVALARSLIFEPHLVLLDEPLSALDRQLREQMQIEIKHIHKRVGVTMIYVTHDQSEALMLSDRIAVFNKGRIEQLAAPRDLYRQPNSLFVASFVGENNLLPGRVAALDGNVCRIEVEGTGQVVASAVNVGSIGSEAKVVIRSEAVKINPAPGSCENCFEARISESMFLGDHTRLRVKLGERHEFLIKVPGDGVTFSGDPSEVVRVGWTLSDGRALCAQPAAET